MEILSNLAYLNVKEIFFYLITLYISVNDISKKEYIINIAQKILHEIPCINRPNLDSIIDELKFTQEQTLQLLSSLDQNVKKSANALIIAICKTILTPQYNKTDHFYEVTINTPFALPGDACELLRMSAISMLKELYSLEDERSQKGVIEALQQSTKSPSQVVLDESFSLLIIRNSIEVVKFYTSLLDSTSERVLLLLNTIVDLFIMMR